MLLWWSFVHSGMFPPMAGTLEIPKRNRKPAQVFTVIVRDVQFWIPVGVLIGGLIVLGWVL
jgi:hypothetical protein